MNSHAQIVIGLSCTSLEHKSSSELSEDVLSRSQGSTSRDSGLAGSRLYLKELECKSFECPAASELLYRN